MSLVILAIGLTATIVVALAYARWQVRHIARDLPARLGIQIQQSTEGFTYSKTEQGRTIFTLHAARALQYRAGGHALLHDVRIQVFHPQDGLADIITGNEFEYDPNNGIVRALDEAHIDLHAPVGEEAAPPSAKSSGAQAAAPDRMIHVVTRGLVFNQKTGVATTDELLEFRLPQGSGHAVGAVYDSKQDQLLLKSKVVIHTQTQNGPAVIHATQSIYDQHVSQVHMEDATYVTAMERASSRAVTILLRPDSSVENINAQRDVRYRAIRGESVSAQSMVAALDEHSRPQAAHFSGDVRFYWQQPQESTSGSAAEGQFFFNHRGHLRQAILDRKARLRQRMLALPSPMERNVRANHLVMDFVEDAAGNAELQHAVATGDARVHQRAIPVLLAARKPVSGSAQPNTLQDTTIRARQLTAQFSAGNQLQRMDGKGNTQLRSVAANGDVDTSFGDTLQVMFTALPPAPKKKRQQKKEAVGAAALVVNANTIQTAVQQGHVMLQQVAATHPASLVRKSKATPPNTQMGTQAEISTATADRAEYHGEMQQMMLTGNPHFEDSDMEMVAQQMQVNRATGEMTATGAVQTTIRGGATAGGLLGGSEATSGSQDATYIIADQAVLHRNTQQAIFTGHARLWQGASVIEAPIIEILQGQQSLQAYGEGKSSEIRCTFVASSAIGAQAQSAPTPIDVTSERLLYSDAERKAHFTGKVTVTTQGDRLQSDVADLYLQSSVSVMPAVPAASAPPTKNNLQSKHNDSGQSSVERMVVQGNVRFTQPGRYGTGARIVYTASDGRFVLTGSEQAPPMIVDAAQGSLTGHVLIFESQQNTIQVQGGNAATTTKTRVQK